MIPTPTEADQATIAEVANAFDIKPDKLWEMYYAVRTVNFHQDLWDIANEYLDELKGE